MTVAAERQPLAYERVEDVIDALRRAGHRVSAPARIVLDTLFEADGPVSAERIASGDEGRQDFELTSVYRNLERLEQLGVVRHVHIAHGPGLYALARDGAREYLVCERCGRVIGVDPAALDDVRETLRHAFGFRARFGHFPIHGHCADCARALASSEADRHKAPARQRGADPPDREHHHEHEHSHVHEHSHAGVTHGHSHSSHEHEHTQHDHQHSHGDRVHSHPHPHESGLEHDHRHRHDEDA